MTSYYPKGVRVMGNGSFDITEMAVRWLAMGFNLNAESRIERIGDRVYLKE